MKVLFIYSPRSKFKMDKLDFKKVFICSADLDVIMFALEELAIEFVSSTFIALL